MNLTSAPEPYLHALFEAVQLAIMAHDDGEHTTITIKLPARSRAGACGDVVCAPGAVRTSTPRPKRPVELRISATTVIERHRRKAR